MQALRSCRNRQAYWRTTVVNPLYIAKGTHADQGAVAGGSYLKRVVTGVDADGSPQYRYIRTQEELKAYEAKHGKDDDQDDKEPEKKKNTLKEKVDKEHKAHVKLLHIKPDSKKDDTKKSLRLYINV